MISGRADWLSELDVSYRDFGLHVSSSAWYDGADNRDDEGHSYAVREPFAFGPPVSRAPIYSVDTSDEGGKQIELSEAFIHGSFDVADDRLVACHVAIESPHRHKQHGRHYRVRVDLTLPGTALVVDRCPDEGHANEDVYAAIDQAFDHAVRRVREAKRRRDAT